LNPFFSIVIPTYNRALLVRECIHSALAQSFGNFEVVVVDDGSNDNTESVVREIPSEKVRYFKKENGERGAARNYGIEKAKGEYVVFMDSDDQMEINHLLVLYAHLLQQQEDFVATKYFFFYDQGRFDANDVKKLSEGYHGFKTFLIGNPMACYFTIRRMNPDLILFREELKYTIMEDWIFLMENLQVSRLYVINEFTMGMREHDSRSMRGSADKIISARRNALIYLTEKIAFREKDREILIGNSDYFCAVHSYIGGNIRAGFQYLLTHVELNGLSFKSTVLFIKMCFRVIWRKKA